MAELETQGQANPACAYLGDGGHDHLFGDDGERQAAAAVIAEALQSRRAIEGGEVKELRQDDLARLRTSGRGLPDMARRLRRLGGEKLRAEHELRQAEAISEYAIGQKIALLPQQEAATAVAAAAPKPGGKAAALEQARYDGAKAAYRKRQRDLDNDPMAVVAGSAFIKTLAQAVGAQKRAGVAYPSVFTKAEAARRAEIYRQAKGEGKIEAMAQALTQTGLYRDLAIRNLLQANPAPTAPIVALHANNPAMSAVLRRLVAAEEKGRRELERGRTEKQIEELRAAVDERLAPFARTAAAAGGEEAAIAEQTGDGVYLYALDLMDAGRSAAGAARTAADKSINEHFDFADTYRVPRAHDVTAVQAYTNAVLAQRRDDATGAELDPAQWRNTPDGGGLMLVGATGQQIADADGNPIRATFGEAEAEGLETAEVQIAVDTNSRFGNEHDRLRAFAGGKASKASSSDPKPSAAEQNKSQIGVKPYVPPTYDEMDRVYAELEELFPSNGLMRNIAIHETHEGRHEDTARPRYYGGVFRVDESTFLETQIQPGLKNQRDKVGKLIGRDWKEVSWRELRDDPLLSGLAGRLALLRFKKPIPTDLAGQATYWKKEYNRSTGKGTAEKFLKSLREVRRKNPKK